MSPYKALYGRKCHTSLTWSERGEKSIMRIHEYLYKTQVIQAGMKAAQYEHKSYIIKATRNIWWEIMFL